MTHVRLVVLLVLLLVLAGHGFAQKRTPSRAREFFVYVGTYTNKDSKGIYAYRFVPLKGTLTPIGIAAETPNPSFLAIHPNHRFLYAVNEISNYQGRREGSVTAFAINAKTGLLTLLNTVSSRGGGAVHLSVDHSGKWVVVANYGGGSAASFPIQGDGSLGAAAGFAQHSGSSVSPQCQRGPRAHEAVVSPDDRFVFVPDLCLDKVFSYRLEAPQGELKPNEAPFANVAPGSGPRHMAFHPDGKSVFVVNEIVSTITAFSYDRAAGSMRELQTLSMLPKDFDGISYASEVEVHPNGKFLYGSNRGLDTIAVFAIGARERKLSPPVLVPTQGKGPRHFAIDPTGAYLFAANQTSGNVVVFRIDPKKGGLKPTGTTITVTAPACLAFLPVE